MNSIIKKPWGYFEVLTSGKNFLVKKIMVKPEGILSLQNHQNRSEHWIVAEGEAEVTIDEKITKIFHSLICVQISVAQSEGICFCNNVVGDYFFIEIFIKFS